MLGKSSMLAVCVLNPPQVVSKPGITCKHGHGWWC